MVLERVVGKCLASQQIRDRIHNGLIREPHFEEKRIQPSSFEPVIGDELFVLDAESRGIFRPNTEEPVSRTMLQLPSRRRQRVSITDGFEIKAGFTYLAPLEQRLTLLPGEYVKSSPKSSLGRVFLNNRLLADYNPCFDEINSQYAANTELQLWLLLQPLTFNLIVWPGLSLNQLRIFTGDAKLTPADIMAAWERTPLLQRRENDAFVATKPIITDAIQVHVDISGNNTYGIAGLRARHNPTPIDLSQKKAYDAEAFFEPVTTTSGEITVRSGEHYLLASKEVLTIPPQLSVELRSHSHIGLNGPLHFAGFIDPGFAGDLVFEVRPDEIADMMLADNMPISTLDVFRNDLPDKLYGKDIGSNYQDQRGPMPSKFFHDLDYRGIANEYKQLNRRVLVQERSILARSRSQEFGLDFLSPDRTKALLDAVQRGFFQYRYDCEADELAPQIIPYMVIFGPNGTVFSYVRAESIEDYGDRRLFGKHSIGIGGHIVQADKPNFLEQCLERETMEEIEFLGQHTTPVPVATIVANDTPVDRTHFGFVYVTHTVGGVKIRESSAVSGRMVPIEEIVNDPASQSKYETWSKLLIPRLKMLSIPS